MLEEAHRALHSLEEDHWWYVGARAVYRVLIAIGIERRNKTPSRMLEVGSGSGGNLPLISQYGPTVGVDSSALALQLTARPPQLGLVQASADALPFRDRSFDGVHLLSVIEHVENDDVALAEAARVCRSDGFITLHTSAMPILWSHHDEANLHKRRYLRSQLRDLLVGANLIPICLSYQNFFTFLPTLLVRLLQKKNESSPRYDMGDPPALLNGFLIRVLMLEAILIRYLSFPIGVDLVSVCIPKERE